MADTTAVRDWMSMPLLDLRKPALQNLHGCSLLSLCPSGRRVSNSLLAPHYLARSDTDTDTDTDSDSDTDTDTDSDTDSDTDTDTDTDTGALAFTRFLMDLESNFCAQSKLKTSLLSGPMCFSEFGFENVRASETNRARIIDSSKLSVMADWLSEMVVGNSVPLLSRVCGQLDRLANQPSAYVQDSLCSHSNRSYSMFSAMSSRSKRAQAA